MKHTKFELKADGSIERVGGFGSFGPTVTARTKSEAATKFLAFAFRAVENTPRVKIREGAYQLAYETLDAINVESGIEGRNGALCASGAKDWREVTDETASFAYYTSETYRSAAYGAEHLTLCA